MPLFVSLSLSTCEQQRPIICRFVVVAHTAARGRDGAKASVSRVPDGEEVGQQICLFSQMTTAGLTHSLVKPTSLQRYHRLKPNAVNNRKVTDEISFNVLTISEKREFCLGLLFLLKKDPNNLMCLRS